MPEQRMLIVFHSTNGQTAKVAARVGDVARRQGWLVDVRSADGAPDPDSYDIVVIGDALHQVHYSKAVQNYVARNLDLLAAMPTALFQLSLTSANPDETHTRAARDAMDAFLDRSGLRPDRTAFFAGSLDYTKYNWIIRRVMRRISKKEGGDTDMTRDYEYTDWDAVERWATVLATTPVDPAHRTEAARNG